MKRFLQSLRTEWESDLAVMFTVVAFVSHNLSWLTLSITLLAAGQVKHTRGGRD